MRIAVIGTGYVGLVTGACLAQTGHRVTCVDVDRAKISLLNDGKVPIYEPGLPEVIGESRRLETLGFSSDSRSVASTADVIFIAVGTPSKEVDGPADLTALDVAIGAIAPSL